MIAIIAYLARIMILIDTLLIAILFIYALNLVLAALEDIATAIREREPGDPSSTPHEKKA